MTATIKIKNSSTAGAIPTSSDLVQGELAINVTDKTIFTKNASGSVTELGKNYTGFKNRIINGAMMIDQRNAGASVNLSSTPAYPVDRFYVRTQSGSGSTAQRSTTAPAGFTNSVVVTIGTGAAPTTGQINYLIQSIEGFSIADFGWGSLNAKAVTLSFWVRSSLTGTFGGAVGNASVNRSYPFTYTISVANTWEQKTVTIAGDTTGTWATDNSTGINLFLDLGSGATYQGTSGSWAAADYRAASGSTQLVATSGATFYITGVQLEKGSTATSFDLRPYGTELALCQRYYWQSATGTYSAVGSGYASSTTVAVTYLKHPVAMRALPTFAISGSPLVALAGGSATISAISNQYAAYDSSRVDFTSTGLTAGYGIAVIGNGSTAYISASSEL